MTVELVLDEDILSSEDDDTGGIGGGTEKHFFSGPNKRTVGGLVVRLFDTNDAPRQKITIEDVQPAGFKGDLLLQCASDKIEIFPTQTGGTKIAFDGTSNKIPAVSVPKDFWVQGVNFSDKMRDIEISVDVKGGKKKVDWMTFTVLWLDKPVVRTSDKVDPDDGKLNEYKNVTADGNVDLKLQTFSAGARMGWGTEASAVVHPTKFKYPGTDLKLERDYEFIDWFNDTHNQNHASFNATIPPGQDTSEAKFRDDDPDPNDKIYDLDGPGLSVGDQPVNNIRRTRNNFKSFASITSEGKSVRCSEVTQYFVRFSMKQMHAPHGNDWQKIDPPDIANDNQAGDGTTKTSRDLT